MSDKHLNNIVTSIKEARTKKGNRKYTLHY